MLTDSRFNLVACRLFDNGIGRISNNVIEIVQRFNPLALID